MEMKRYVFSIWLKPRHNPVPIMRGVIEHYNIFLAEERLPKVVPGLKRTPIGSTEGFWEYNGSYVSVSLTTEEFHGTEETNRIDAEFRLNWCKSPQSTQSAGANPAERTGVI